MPIIEWSPVLQSWRDIVWPAVLRRECLRTTPSYHGYLNVEGHRVLACNTRLTYQLVGKTGAETQPSDTSCGRVQISCSEWRPVCLAFCRWCIAFISFLARLILIRISNLCTAGIKLKLLFIKSSTTVGQVVKQAAIAVLEQ